MDLFVCTSVTRGHMATIHVRAQYTVAIPHLPEASLGMLHIVLYTFTMSTVYEGPEIAER